MGVRVRAPLRLLKNNAFLQKTLLSLGKTRFSTDSQLCQTVKALATKGGGGNNDLAQLRQDAMELVKAVLADSDATPRERLRACSVVLAMSESDLLLDEDDALLATIKRIGLSLESSVRAKSSATATSGLRGSGP